MSGKYIQFTLPCGKKINGKSTFCKQTGIKIHILNSKLNVNQKFTHNDLTYKYEYIYGFMAPREYIPNSTGTKSKDIEKPNVKHRCTRFKFSDTHVYEFGAKGNLLMTYSKDRFEQKINKLFCFVDTRYLE